MGLVGDEGSRREGGFCGGEGAGERRRRLRGGGLMDMVGWGSVWEMVWSLRQMLLDLTRP